MTQSNFPHEIHAAFHPHAIAENRGVMCHVFDVISSITVFDALCIKYPYVVSYDKDGKEVKKYQNL